MFRTCQRVIHLPTSSETALRAFTRLHAAGKLNLAGSFIGLRERARKDE